MLAPITHVLPLTNLRRQRLLPAPGRVLARKGQQVNALEVVAEADLEPGHQLLDIGNALGVTPQKAEAAMQRQPGERVAQGDLIAGPVGWPKRVVRATHPGEIVKVRKGQVLVKLDSPQYQLRAGYPGRVAALIGERGVEIVSTGALVQGAWGNGNLDFGLLNVLVRRPEDVFSADQLDISLRGSIVLAGFCSEEGVLRGAEELPVRGLVLASMSAALIPVAASLSFPVLVLEGFGLLPINSAAFRLLTSNQGREAAVIAEPRERYGFARPELFIPLPVDEAAADAAASAWAEPREAAMLAPGLRVRALRAPYSSQIGVVIALRPDQETFSSGIRAPAATVRLESGSQVVLPLANLEVLE
jgi:hypothetical protein